MYLAFGVLLLFITVFLHEYGHLRAMHRHGIKIKKLSIGVDVPYFTLRIHHPKFCFGIPVCISPLLIMGSVELENAEELDNLSLTHQLEIYGGGIIMNLAIGFFFIMLTLPNFHQSARFFVIWTLVLVFGKRISAFLLPFFSLAMFYFVPVLLVDTFRAIPNAGKSTSMFVINLRAVNFQEALMGVGIISIALAILNLIPMQPLDGGKIISACGKRWLPSVVMQVYDVLTVVIMLLVILINIYDLVLALTRLLIKAFV